MPFYFNPNEIKEEVNDRPLKFKYDPYALNKRNSGKLDV